MTTANPQDRRLPEVQVNGRTYGPADGPVVVVCVDGSEPDYHEQAMAAGRMPFLAELLGGGGAAGADAAGGGDPATARSAGCSLPAESAMPSFTNPNNLSIATGVPPSVHGISGNYIFDAETGEEVMMNDPKWLRAPTLFAAYQQRGASVAVITAKDKLRRLLGAGLETGPNGICFSAEHADQVTKDNGGLDDVLAMVDMPLPSVYSADLSRLVMAAGVEVLRGHTRERPDLTYLSLTDYIQHKHAPGSLEANDFYAMLDQHCQALDELGCTLVITADHGMNAKSDTQGRPVVRYLQKQLDDWLGAGASRVILPITDPYTVHHGALGSFATVHLTPGVDTEAIAGRLAALDGIELVLSRADACARFELPADRIGDLVVIGDRGTALGTTPDRHDLSQLDVPLRSHGGLAEQPVPFLVNRPVTGLPAEHRLRNYDAYWVALNFTHNA